VACGKYFYFHSLTFFLSYLGGRLIFCFLF
jgi:hypothetical protein